MTNNVTHHPLQASLPRHFRAKCFVLELLIEDFLERVFAGDEAKQGRGLGFFRNPEVDLLDLLLSSYGVNGFYEDLNPRGERVKVLQSIRVGRVRHSSFVFAFPPLVLAEGEKGTEKDRETKQNL